MDRLLKYVIYTFLIKQCPFFAAQNQEDKELLKNKKLSQLDLRINVVAVSAQNLQLAAYNQRISTKIN